MQNESEIIEKIYILLSRTTTWTARAVRLFERGRFSNSYISFEPKTN